MEAVLGRSHTVVNPNGSSSRSLPHRSRLPVMEAVLGRSRTVLNGPTKRSRIRSASLSLSSCLQAEIVANFKGVYKLFQIA